MHITCLLIVLVVVYGILRFIRSYKKKSAPPVYQRFHEDVINTNPYEKIDSYYNDYPF
jgi:hypothetical protein